jgi:predicted nucleic acid-binding protein
MQVFIDSGYLIALDIRNDERHAETSRHWREFVRTGPQLVTTNLVLAEVLAFFQSRGLHEKGVELGRRLLRSDYVRLVYADEGLCRAGFEYLEAHGDKQYSFTDCVSFVLMNRLHIRQALAFDRHFEQAGFVMLPRA